MTVGGGGDVVVGGRGEGRTKKISTKLLRGGGVG